MTTAIVNVIGHLRSGDFLDRARVRRIAVIVLTASLVVLIGLIATSRGGVDIQGRPLGPDFFSFWTAARVAHDHGGEAAYDIFRNRDLQSEHLGGESPYPVSFWSPPPFLLLMLPFAALPFAAAWAAFSALTFAVYFAAMRRLAPPAALSSLLIVAAPGVLANVAIGQAGLLFAGLFATAAYFYRTRPLLAGVALGFIALKPQYGVLIPLCLVLAGRWKIIFAAATTVLGAVALATAAFGISVWSAFASNAVAANYVLLESGAVRWEKNASVYAAMRRYGADAPLAWSAHVIAAAAVVLSLVILWRSAASDRLKLAGLIVASLFVPPYVLDYDLVMLAPAIALVVACALETRFLGFEKLTLALAWAAPAAALPLSIALKAPLGLMAVAACYAIILVRAFATSEPGGARGASP